MKEFQKAIKGYLDKRAAEDSQFAQAYKKKGKSIADCCNYILQQAKKRGNAVVMSDDEVYGLAIHYYDENIDPKECRPVGGAEVSAAHDIAVELTDEEKEKARELAIAKYREEQVAAIRAEERAKRAEKAKKDKERQAAFAAKQLSLFD